MKTKKTDLQKKLSLIWGFLDGCKRYFVASIIMIALSALADMLTPQIVRAAIDNAIGGKEPAFSESIVRFVDSLGGFAYIGQHLWMMSIAVMAVALVKVLSQYFFRVNNAMGSQTLIKNMRDRLFIQIQHLPYAWHMKNQTGDIIQRCTSDIETTRGFVSDQMTGIFRIIAMLAMSIYFMFSMSWRLAAIAIIPVPFVLYYSLTFHKSIGKSFTECDTNEGILSAMAQENLTGVRVVRAFGREKYEVDRFHKQNDHYTGLWVNLGKIMSQYWSTADVIADAQLLLVVVFGAIFCVKGLMTSGEYVAFITYNSMLIWPIRQLGRMIAEMSKTGVSIDRIRYIMESETEKDREKTLPVPNGDIKFEHVSFSYDGAKETLHDINFTAKEGTTVGILGGTGSGKSTLMLLLDRLYELPESCGKISIGGVDIRDMKASELRSHIGIVLQEPYLFSRTLQENIGITNPDITLSDIREAARSACLDDTIEGFTKGYDTFVGERGVTLSGGQKQRAAIARMLVQKTPIMVLDDSLSAVDTETDAKIRKSLEAHFGGSTVFLISHRITTLAKADLILVMEHGRIVESGTPEELRENSVIYKKIYDIQTGTREEVEA